ncbi:MAG: hypothetical protein R3C24_15715 [Cyanobacteriota/Melainabacteria group bacterium]
MPRASGRRALLLLLQSRYPAISIYRLGLIVGDSRQAELLIATFVDVCSRFTQHCNGACRGAGARPGSDPR